VAWRELAQDISARRVHIGLVEGDPEPAKISDRVDNLTGEPFKQLRRIRLEERASALEPLRMGEVMQTNDRLNSSLAQTFEHLPVALQGGRVKAAFFRFNTAPLQ